jgi:hypothetical protein
LETQVIKRLRVKNYKGISELDLEFSNVSLLMGSNGTGKSSVLDILNGLKRILVANELCGDVFSPRTVPRWQSRDRDAFEQFFSLVIESPRGDFEYNLRLNQDLQRGKTSVAEEILTDERGTLFAFESGEVVQYDDNYAETARYRRTAERSALAGAVVSGFRSNIECFNLMISRITCLRLVPSEISSISTEDHYSPDRFFGNFASWYRAALVGNAAAGGSFLDELTKVLEGFRSLNLIPYRQGYSALHCLFARDTDAPAEIGRDGSSEYELSFEELSDGQRTLIVLYALLHFHFEDGTILCIDEPENFLALEELQPFVHRLLDEVESHRWSQTILASHHPKIFNALARDYGMHFRRNSAGEITAGRFVAPSDSVLPVSELVARGEIL